MHYLTNLFKMTGLKFVGAILAFFAPHLMKIFRIQIVDGSVTEFVRNLVWKTVNYREKNGVVRQDFLDNLMQLRKERTIAAESDGKEIKFKIDGDDFVAQCFAFLTAGIETSSLTMSFFLYEVALHPEIQERLREEMSQVLANHNNEVTYDAIQEMTYLDMVVSETLRKYPIVPFLDRVATSDYILSVNEVQNVVLRKGTAVYVPLMGVHHDPKYYPEPDRFDPERFTEENKRSRPNFTFFPFGEGPRICIGMRFGLMNLKTGLIHIVSRYQVSPCKDTPVPIEFDQANILLQSKQEICLTFKRITT